MTRVLFVCTANVCRSPMAAVVAEHLARQAGLAAALRIDSAGTRAGAIGTSPDPRARAALERRGYSVSPRRPRRIHPRDFEAFDLLLAMDRDNIADLRRLSGYGPGIKIRLLLDLAPELAGQEVPDPYYGNAEGFERVLDLCEAGVRGLLTTLTT